MIDLDELEARWPLDDGHKANPLTGRCVLCGQVMPCDWSEITADLHTLIDHIRGARR